MLGHRGHPVVGPIVDGQCGAEVQTAIPLGARDRHQHLASDHAANLDGCRPDARRASVDQRRPPDNQPPLEDKGVPRRNEHLGESTGQQRRHASGEAHGLVLVDGQSFGMGAAGDDAHHFVAFRPAGRPVAKSAYSAGEFQPRYFMLGGWTRVEAHTLEKVCAVQGTGQDLDDDLFRSGFRCRDVLQPEDLGSAVSVEYDRPHAPILPARPPGGPCRGGRSVSLPA